MNDTNNVTLEHFSYMNRSISYMITAPWCLDVSGSILWMRPANERRRYIVTPSPIGWTHTQNDPWCLLMPWCLPQLSVTVATSLLQGSIEQYSREDGRSSIRHFDHPLCVIIGNQRNTTANRCNFAVHTVATDVQALIGTRAPSQYPKRRLFVRSREVSKPRDWYFKLSHRFEIWQAHRPILNTNLAASRLYEISRKEVFSHIWDGVQATAITIGGTVMAKFAPWGWGY